MARRRKKKSIFKSTFYRVYFALVALALIGIVLGTMWLMGTLRQVDSGVFVPMPGDRLLLCSDGLYDELTIREIQDVMLKNPDNPSMELVKSALNHGGNDNVTCALIERLV